MTNKERRFITLMASGRPLEEAAAEAGYNLAYAQRKASEAAFCAAVEAKREALARQTPKARRKKGLQATLDEIINDPLSSPAERVAAVRASLAVKKAAAPPPAAPPVIIDDIPDGEE